MFIDQYLVQPSFEKPLPAVDGIKDIVKQCAGTEKPCNTALNGMSPEFTSSKTSEISVSPV